MPIELRPKDEAKLYAEAGKILGKAQATQKQQAIDTALLAQKAFQEWELEKMRLNSEQDFQHELNLRQVQYDREIRARQWQTEKMELASRLDFEQQEKERLRKKETFNSGIEIIDKNEGLSDTQKATAKFLLASRYTDIEEAAPYLGLKPQKQGLFDFGIGETTLPSSVPGVSTAENPLGLNLTEGVAAPLSALPQAVLALEQQNQFEVVSPNGRKETIDADQWPEYKAKGYILAQIKKLKERRHAQEVASNVLAGGYGGV